jgi:hypothetical protein
MFTRRLPAHLIATVVLLDVLASPSTARADDKWIQIGSGIFSPNTGNTAGVHHQSGRLTQVSWAWDNVQGRNVLWAGASHGGLWKSIIDGSGTLTSWVTITDNFPGSHTLGSFAIKKGDSNYIVIGTGGSWGNGNGIYYTVKAGEDGWSLATFCSSTWSCGPARPERVRRLVADRLDSTGATLVAATSDGVWQSFDFGQTWFSRLSGVDVTDVVQDTGDPSRWYAGAVKEGIYRSTTYATSWVAHGKGIKGSIARISLAACDSDAQYLYALVVNSNDKLNGVYRSATRGDTWENIYSDNNTVNAADQGGHTCAIVCDPSDPEHIFLGLGQPAEIKIVTKNKKIVVNVSTFDGGHADYNFMQFSADGSHLHIANDGGYYYYDIATGTVNDVGNLLGINALELGGAKTTAPYSTLQGGLASSWSNPNVFVAGLQDNGVVRGNVSKDPAITLVTYGGDGRHVSIRPDDPDVIGFVDNDSSIRDLFDKGTIEHIDFNLSKEKSAPVLIEPAPGLTFPVVYTADQDHSLPALAFYTNNVWYSDVLQGVKAWFLVSNDPITGPGVISHVDATVNLKSYQIVATVAGDTRVFAYIGDLRIFGLGLLPLSDITPPLPSSPTYTKPDARINADRSTFQPNTLYYSSGVGKPRLAYVSRKGGKDFGKDWKDITGDIVSKSDDADLLKLIGNPTSSVEEYFLATSKGVFRGARGTDGEVHWKDYSDGLRHHEQVDDIVINFDNVTKPTLYVATRGRGFWRRTID